MSATNRDRFDVLHEVRKGHLTQKPGGEKLGVTERWVGKLVAPTRKRETAGFSTGYAGGKGRGRSRDHQRWPNAPFTEQGRFSLTAAFVSASQPSRR